MKKPIQHEVLMNFKGPFVCERSFFVNFYGLTFKNKLSKYEQMVRPCLALLKLVLPDQKLILHLLQ